MNDGGWGEYGIVRRLFEWFKVQPLPPSPDVLHEETLKIIWLGQDKQWKTYRRIAARWLMEASPGALDALALLGETIWEGRQGIYARPGVGVLYDEESVVGLLSGFLDERFKGFYIEHLVAHPKYSEVVQGRIRELLVNGAIDVSIANGQHGWVSCASTTETYSQWRGLGFSTEEKLPGAGVYMSKMGYFR